MRDCWYCCFKHIATANIAYEEIMHGHNDHLHNALLCGNLSCAEWHASEKWPEIEEIIRGSRKGFFESEAPIPFDYILRELWRIAEESKKGVGND